MSSSTHQRRQSVPVPDAIVTVLDSKAVPAPEFHAQPFPASLSFVYHSANAPLSPIMPGLSARPKKWLLATAVFALGIVLILYAGASHDMDLSRYRHLMSFREPKGTINVPEIYGLLNIVLPSPTRHEHLLPSQHARVLAEGPGRGHLTNLDYGIYDVEGNNDYDWNLRRQEIDRDYPIVVFGKSYCPYTKRLLSLLQELPISPRPYVVQEDLRDDTHLMQDLLLRLTGRRTVPNFILHGQSLGGNDDIHALHRKSTNLYNAKEGGKLRELLEQAGVQWDSSKMSTMPHAPGVIVERSWIAKDFA